MRNTITAIACLACVLALVACANQPTIDLQKQFQSEVNKIRQQHNFPGMTAAYILNDGKIVSVSSGFANIETQALMTDNTRMLSASTGKSFVGTLCIALALDGQLSLDKPVSRWLGKYNWFKRLPNHESITLRHLLTHSAGLPDHVHMETFQKTFATDWQSTKNKFPPNRLVEFILDKEPLFPVGQGWAYSDTGYILAGMVIEEVTDHTYYEEIHRRFLKPLGLKDTTPSDRQDLDNLAQGYMNADNPFGLPDKTLDENHHLHWHPGIEWTGGGLVSTSRDLAQWGAVLFSGKALPDVYLSELFNSVDINAEDSSNRYGTGVAIKISGHYGSVYGHSGWIPGYISSFRYYSTSGITIAFQINTDIGIVANDKDILGTIEERLARVLIP